MRLCQGNNAISWDFVKEEIMGFVNEFYEQKNRFVRSLNSTFLVLIPKKGMQWISRTSDLLI